MRRSSRPVVLGLAAALAAIFSVAAAQQDAPAPGISVTPAGGDLIALLADARALAPAGPGIAIHARAIQIGHLEISLEEGLLAPLRTPKGLTLGFFFEGAGRYRYTSGDPGDRLVLAQNVAHEGRKELFHEDALQDTFKRLVVYFAAPEFDDLWGGSPPGSAPAADGVVVPLDSGRRSDFERIWKRIQESYLPFDHHAAIALLNGPPRQYLYAEFEGGAETAGFSYDRISQFEERLFLFRKVQGYDYRWQRPLSHQPIEGGRSKHPGDLTLRDIHVEVATEDNRSVTINSELTMAAGADRVRAARLDLVNNRDPNHVNWASSKNPLRIVRVTDDSGQALPFSHRYYEVIVELPHPLARGQALRLRFETQGEILTDAHGRRDDNFFELTSDAWYPRPSSWSLAGFSARLKVRV
ncbi:MAG TPA: hypothetical protein VGA64_04020, partial [Candidatus Polarisedimenticolia bacterium]